jgi:hypothetical protein
MTELAVIVTSIMLLGLVMFTINSISSIDHKKKHV